MNDHKLIINEITLLIILDGIFNMLKIVDNNDFKIVKKLGGEMHECYFREARGGIAPEYTLFPALH